ncbi:MAG: AraC family transcriptional regulator [Clostridia bacterium]|nr:AraC family transcriptional regulator [Clostridia bacterium]
MSKNLLSDIFTYWVEKCVYPENNSIESHSHDFYHCLCIISGKGEMICNDTVYEMHEKRVFLACPSDIHGFKNISSEDMVSYELKFDINNDSLKAKLISLPFCLDVQEQVTELFAQVYNESKSKKPFNNEITDTLIIQLLFTIIRSTYENLTGSRKYGSVEYEDSFSKILSYLERNMSKDIGLDQMAQTIHLEKVYFLKKFKKLTDMTPMRYLKSIRMKKAKALLQYSDMSITLIAESVGFKNIQYFSKVFTEYNKINPSSYRNKFIARR